MHRSVVLLIFVAAAPLLAAELPSSYTLLENHGFNADLNAESGERHAVFKKEPKLEPKHPVYRGQEPKNEGRARIEPVRHSEPLLKHESMLADQPPASTETNRIDNLSVPNYDYNPGPSEVAYPDIPYAPGYGYDAGYALSNNYDMYNNYLMEPDTSTFGLLWSQVPDSRTMVSYMGRTISWIFSSIFVLLLGSVMTIGVCSYTNVCAFKFHGVGPIHEEMRSLMTPERLEKISNAADFVKTAIDKYQKIQTVASGAVTRSRRAIFH